MELFLPYLMMIGGGIIGAMLVCLSLKKLSIGFVGNCLTGMAGGIGSSFLLKYLFIYIPSSVESFAIIGLIAGVVSMLVIGFTRQLISE